MGGWRQSLSFSCRSSISAARHLWIRGTHVPGSQVQRWVCVCAFLTDWVTVCVLCACVISSLSKPVFQGILQAFAHLWQQHTVPGELPVSHGGDHTRIWRLWVSLLYVNEFVEWLGPCHSPYYTSFELLKTTWKCAKSKHFSPMIFYKDWRVTLTVCVHRWSRPHSQPDLGFWNHLAASI